MHYNNVYVQDISSPPPGSTQDDEEPSGPSAVIAGTDKNFKQEVMDSTADAMIEFYAPWCKWDIVGIIVVQSSNVSSNV